MHILTDRCPNVQATLVSSIYLYSSSLPPVQEGNMSFPPISITNSFIIEASSPLLFQEFSSLLPPLDQIRSPFCRSRMNGYSRIRQDSTARSKSVDFADLTFQHRTTPRFISSCSQFRFQETKPNLSNAAKIVTKHNSIPEEGAGEVFGIILSQKQPILSAPDKSAPPEQKALPEQEGFSAVKSLSVKRSSSVSQGYSRIRNQFNLAAEDDDHCQMKLPSQNRCAKKRGKYLKAFMRVFGL